MFTHRGGGGGGVLTGEETVIFSGVTKLKALLLDRVEEICTLNGHAERWIMFCNRIRVERMGEITSFGE